MASEAMSVDSGPESEFDFGDLEAGSGSRKGRARGSSEKNILVQLQTEQNQGRREGRPPVQVPPLKLNTQAEPARQPVP